MVCLIFLTGATSENNLAITQSEHLKIIPIADGIYIHQSYLKTEDFGKVVCNGLIYENGGEAVVFDTPTDEVSSRILISWLTDSLNVSIKAIVPTHFHSDCLGGIQMFHDERIASIAHQKTIDLAGIHQLPVPKTGFKQDTSILVGDNSVLITFPGEGHTIDNVVAYIQSNQVLFGGCLVKSLGAGQGFTGDANLNSWAATVEQIKMNFPQIKIVVPGHGMAGNHELLDYTISLFTENQEKQ